MVDGGRSRGAQSSRPRRLRGAGGSRRLLPRGPEVRLGRIPSALEAGYEHGIGSEEPLQTFECVRDLPGVLVEEAPGRPERGRELGGDEAERSDPLSGEVLRIRSRIVDAVGIPTPGAAARAAAASGVRAPSGAVSGPTASRTAASGAGEPAFGLPAQAVGDGVLAHVFDPPRPARGLAPGGEEVDRDLRAHESAAADPAEQVGGELPGEEAEGVAAGRRLLEGALDPQALFADVVAQGRLRSSRGQVVGMTAERTEPGEHITGVEGGECPQGAQAELDEDVDELGPLPLGVRQGGDRLGGEELHGLPRGDSARLPGGDPRGEDGRGDAGEELPPRRVDECGDERFDGRGLIGIAVPEGIEGDRERSRCEQREAGDELFECAHPAGEVTIVDVFVPRQHLSLGAAVVRRPLVAADGDARGSSRCVGGDDATRVEDGDRGSRAELVFGGGCHGRPVGDGEDEDASAVGLGLS